MPRIIGVSEDYDSWNLRSPFDEDAGICLDCDSYVECPADCGWGWCLKKGAFTIEKQECDYAPVVDAW